MNKKIEKAKQVYHSIKIPPQLSSRINEAFNPKKTRKLIFKKRSLQIVSGLCTACIAFVILVNISPTFAQSMQNVPIISNIVKWISVKEIKESDELDIIYAQIPNIANTGDPKFEEKINAKINEEIEKLLAKSKSEAQEAKSALLQYDKDHVFEPINVNISYDIKCQQDGILSFIITQNQTDNMHANRHIQKFMYNVDLNKNKELTLKDLLGNNYKNIINQEIEKQILEKEQNGEADFFSSEDFPYLEHGGWFEGIGDNQKFYINEKGNIVIVFDKYEIAPGYMGMPEFEISV